MTTDKLDRAVEALRTAPACPEHAARRVDLIARNLLREDDLPGGWSWIFDEDNPCGACARLAVLAVARVLLVANTDGYSPSMTEALSRAFAAELRSLEGT
mgnify:CR=1 FL=1